METSPAEVHAGLRGMALRMTADSLKLQHPAAGEAYGIVMDMGMERGTATVTSFSTGDASVYLSTGGGMIGGGPIPAVNRAARDFVATTSLFTARMRAVTDTPTPALGQVYFYALTGTGLFFHGATESELASGHSEFERLYAAGQMVITAFRTSHPPK